MSHYFSVTPSGPERRREIEVPIRGHRVRLETAAGVFSGDRLDPGTTVLLDAVEDPPATGTLLDLGCGWGPIAIAMALASPEARVLAVDVNERALALTADNATRLGLTNVETHLPEDLLAAEPDLRLDALWSNPPIRIGKAALHEILRTWLPRLTPGARAQLVVQRNLGSDSLQRWIAAELGRDVTRLTSVNGFRVLTVR
ncbi:class I SAM-dependent methyltransferase [Occultella glacieicola]|uniref:class I SAM-dependent methyltransferase n=1 Tax=Occultella glacieicola TaxID=2518684 RepID=UPI001F3BD184|nr:methyltransferase [Occultella glacieicola]